MDNEKPDESLARIWLEQSPYGAFCHDSEGVLVFANQSIAQLLGYTLEEITKDHVSNLFQYFRQDYFQSSLAHVKDAKQVVMEAVLLKKNGESVVTRMHTHHVALDKDYFCCTFRTHSDDGELYETQERYSSLARAVNRSDSIMQGISEGAARYLEVDDVENSALYLVTRVAQTAVVCRAYVFKNLQSDHTNLDAAQWLEYVAPGSGLAESKGLVVNYQALGLNNWVETLRNGEVVRVSIAKATEHEAAFLNQRGIKSCILLPVFVEREWWGFMGFDDCVSQRGWRNETNALSITAGLFGLAVEREQAEQAKEDHRNEIAHHSRLSMMGEMASGIAHELNQPLTAISNFNQAALAMLDKPDQKQLLAKTIGQAAHQAKRAAEILMRIRRFVRKTDTQTEIADINHIVQNALQYADAPLRRQQIEVVVSPSLLPATTHMCVVQIEQVVLNLVINALDAMEEGEAEINRLEIKIEIIDDYVLTSIRDFGQGISPSMESVLFEPFESSKRDGLGMGLSICKTIVEAHQGRLWLDKSVTSGACFKFSLPFATP